MSFDSSSVDAWLRDFLRYVQEQEVDDDNDDALSGTISLLRRILDKIDTGIPLSETHRRFLVEQLPGIARNYDDGYDISDDVDDLARTINGWD